MIIKTNIGAADHPCSLVALEIAIILPKNALKFLIWLEF